jgi:hypothetical protein
MKLLFHNRRFPALNGVVVVGQCLHGFRSTEHSPYSAFTDPRIDCSQKVFHPNGRVPCGPTVQELAYIHFSPVTNIRKEML